MNLNNFVDISSSVRLCSSHLFLATRTFSTFLYYSALLSLSLLFLKVPPWICCFLSWSRHIVVIKLLSVWEQHHLGFLDSPHVTSICTSISDRNVLYLFRRTDQTNNWRKNRIFFFFLMSKFCPVSSCQRQTKQTFSHSFYYERSFYSLSTSRLHRGREKVFVEHFSSKVLTQSSPAKFCFTCDWF